jgi:hypothetical protein
MAVSFGGTGHINEEGKIKDITTNVLKLETRVWKLRIAFQQPHRMGVEGE